MNEIKAWAFLCSSKEGKYIPKGDGWDIYLEKPEPIKNPFDYFTDKKNWKPTRIRIIIED